MILDDFSFFFFIVGVDDANNAFSIGSIVFIAGNGSFHTKMGGSTRVRGSALFTVRRFIRRAIRTRFCDRIINTQPI
jgi:hypothetical protein